MAKVIKLTDNSAVTLLPITDSAYVQHRWKEGATGGTTVTSVQDALNNVIDRVDGVHASGSDNQHLSGSGTASASANNSSVAYINLDGNGGKVGIQGTAGTSAVNKIGQADVVVSYDTSGINNIRIKVSYTDTNTHAGSHSINASQTSGGAAYINLSGTNCTGTVGIRGTGATTVTYTSNGDIVINSSDSDKKVTAGERTASTKYYLLGATNATNQQPKYDSNVYLDTTAGKFYAQLAYTTTPADTDNSTRIPTTAWVKSRIGDLTGAMRYKGTIGRSDATVTSLPAKHDVGDVYIVKTNGTYAGTLCAVGDMIICNTAGSSANDAHWTVVPLNFTVENAPDVIEVPYTTVESAPFTIATVDGKDITTTVKHAQVTTNNTDLKGITPAHGGNFTIIGNVEVENGHVIKLQKQTVTLPTDSDTADHILGNSTATNHTGLNQVNPYLKIWSSKSSGNAILIQGAGGITATSSNSGKTLTINQNFSTQNVLKTVSSNLTNFNPMKYIEVATIDDGINDTWLSTIGNGSTSYSVTNTANTNVTNVNATGTTCVAYVKSV